MNIHLSFGTSFSGGSGTVYLVSFLFGAVVALVHLYPIWKKYGRDLPARPTVAPAFASPDKLRPFELWDIAQKPIESSRPVTATIVDLLARGYLGYDGQTLTLLKEPDADLHIFERILLNDLFGRTGQKAINLEDFRGKLVFTHWSMSVAVRNELLKAGVFDPRAELSKKKLWPELIIGIFLSIFAMLIPPLALFGWGLLLMGFLFNLLLSRTTREGAGFREEARGYYHYLEKTLRDRAKFYEESKIFDRELAYAILIGLTKRFDQEFRILLTDNQGNLRSEIPTKALRRDEALSYDEIYPTAKSTLLIAEEMLKENPGG